MKFLNTLFTLLSFTTLVLADSQAFYMMTIRSGSGLQYSGITVQDNELVVNGQSSTQAVITDAGQWKVGNEYVVVGTNSQMSLTENASEATTGFSIEGGFLSYSQGFYAIGVDGEYALYFGSKADPNIIPFAIMAKATGEATNTVPDFGVSSNTITTPSSSSTHAAKIHTRNAGAAAKPQVAGLRTGMLAVGAMLL